MAACLHVTAETANLVGTLSAGGAEVGLCAANPLSTQDDVVAALVADGGVAVHARRGESAEEYAAHVDALVARGPQVTIDDGADLIGRIHETDPRRRRRDAGGHRGDDRGPLAGARPGGPRRAGVRRCWRSTSRAPSGPSTIVSARASRRWTGSCGPRTCCWRVARVVVLGVRLDREGCRAARAGCGRFGDRVRGGSPAGAGGAHGGLRGDAGPGGGEPRRRVRDGDRRARRAARRALRADEGRGGARERGALRRGDQARGPACAGGGRAARGAAAGRAAHARGRSPPEPAGAGSRREPRRRRRPSGGGDGRLLRGAGAVRRVPGGSRRGAASRACCRSRMRSTARWPA